MEQSTSIATHFQAQEKKVQNIYLLRYFKYVKTLSWLYLRLPVTRVVYICFKLFFLNRPTNKINPLQHFIFLSDVKCHLPFVNCINILYQYISRTVSAPSTVQVFDTHGKHSMYLSKLLSKNQIYWCDNIDVSERDGRAVQGATHYATD